jgi:aminoglycoside 3'-phosphotransferase-1
MTALDGQCAEDCRDGETLRAVGAWLRGLHEWPVEDCPFVGLGLAQARRNVAAGRVDEEDFDEERQGWTAAEVLALLERTRPRREDRVVTHGDFTLENVLVKRGRVTGMLDVGRLGVGDRYQDLALVTRGLCGEEELELLAGYGLKRLDARKVEYYRCMDELM